MIIPIPVWRARNGSNAWIRTICIAGSKDHRSGQAIDRMIDEDVPCEDILAQINAAKSALHGCGKVVLEGHIKHCVRDGIDTATRTKQLRNFTKAVERFSNMG